MPNDFINTFCEIELIKSRTTGPHVSRLADFELMIVVMLGV